MQCLREVRTARIPNNESEEEVDPFQKGEVYKFRKIIWFQSSEIYSN